MQTALRSAALGLNFVLLAFVPWLERSIQGGPVVYVVATIVLAALDVLVVVTWSRTRPPVAAIGTVPRPLGVALIVATAVVLLAWASASWLDQVLRHPHDPRRADQLVVVQLGIERLLAGDNPYAVYHLPWEATLAYGPVLWGPFVAPYLLRVDLRFLSIVGALFVPIASAMAAVHLARRARWLDAVGWLTVCVAVASSPSLEHFISFAHTAGYWPLLALFAWLVADRRWRTAAVVLGLLVAARATMVAIVPVLWMTVWQRDRGRAPSVVVLTTATAVAPFLPFLVWDAAALWHSVVGGYETSIKGYLWKGAVVQHSIGVTGWLLALGWRDAVLPVQGLVVLGTWVACWRGVTRGDAPLPWMALALLAFSMTALWPVYYLYLDVFLLFVCAALAEAPCTPERRHPAVAWVVVCCVALLWTVATVWLGIPRRARIDVGSARARPYLRGFGDTSWTPARTFAVPDPAGATIALPRRSLRDATISVEWRSVDGSATPRDVEVALNHVPIGRTRPGDRWGQTSFAAPGELWWVGANELRFAAIPPAGAPDLARTVPSIAIDRVTIRRAGPAR